MKYLFSIWRNKKFAAIFLIMVSSSLYAKEKSATKVHSIQTNDTYASIYINNLHALYGNNGAGAMVYPKGSSYSTIFADGIVWGGYSRGSIKVGGSTYLYGLQAGRIVTVGTNITSPIADNPTLTRNRIYRVRPDITPNTSQEEGVAILQNDISIENADLFYMPLSSSKSIDQLFSQYIQDWNEWPADQGAPFEDKNGNGVYDPDIDIPVKSYFLCKIFGGYSRYQLIRNKGC